MSVPVFFTNLNLFLTKTSLMAAGASNILKKRQKLVELYFWHRKIYANEKTVLL